MHYIWQNPTIALGYSHLNGNSTVTHVTYLMGWDLPNGNIISMLHCLNHYFLYISNSLPRPIVIAQQRHIIPLVCLGCIIYTRKSRLLNLHYLFHPKWKMVIIPKISSYFMISRKGNVWFINLSWWYKYQVKLKSYMIGHFHKKLCFCWLLTVQLYSRLPRIYHVNRNEFVISFQVEQWLLNCSKSVTLNIVTLLTPSINI